MKLVANRISLNGASSLHVIAIDEAGADLPFGEKVHDLERIATRTRLENGLVRDLECSPEAAHAAVQRLLLALRADERAAIAAEAETAGRPPPFVVIPDGAQLLDAVATHYRRYVVLTPFQADTLALWTAHTHTMEAADTTPYIHPTSAEKESGKTRTAEVAATMVSAPLSAESISPAALARSVDRGVTLLLDEADTIFRRGPASESAELLRGVLDSGWRRGGQYVRMVGQGADMQPHAFQTFGPKMIIGIGALPGTLASRSIAITLRRRRRDTEPLEPFRFRKAAREGDVLRQRLATWGSAHSATLRSAEPTAPDELGDRMQDSWEPLLAIADLAGGDWPERARRAAIELSAARHEDAESLGVRLLHDLRDVFGDAQRKTTSELVQSLIAIEGAPWADLPGRGSRAGRSIDKQVLARLLRPYGVAPQQLKEDGQNLRGYKAASLADPWARYCAGPHTLQEKPLPRHLPGDEATDTESGPATGASENPLPLPSVRHNGQQSSGVARPDAGVERGLEMQVVQLRRAGLQRRRRARVQRLLRGPRDGGRGIVNARDRTQQSVAGKR